MQEGYYSAMDPAANVANQLKANSHMFAIGVGDRRDGCSQRAADPGGLGHEELPGVPDRDGRLHAHHRFQRSRGCTGGPRLQALQRHGDGQEGDGQGGEGRLGLEVRLGVQRAAVLQSPASQFDYRWFLPGQAGTSSEPGTTATQSGNTAAAGTLDFVWRPNSHTALSNITISETPVPAAFEAESVTCTSRGHNDLRQRRSGHGGVVHPLGPEGARPRQLRRPEPPQALDGPGGQAVGRRSQLDNDLRRRHRRPRLTTPRPSRPRAERAPHSTTRSRRG